MMPQPKGGLPQENPSANQRRGTMNLEYVISLRRNHVRIHFDIGFNRGTARGCRSSLVRGGTRKNPEFQGLRRLNHGHFKVLFQIWRFRNLPAPPTTASLIAFTLPLAWFRAVGCLDSTHTAAAFSVKSRLAVAAFTMAMLLKGRRRLWEVCVGLEVHAQILSKTKLFSPASARSDFTTPPNKNVSLFDAAFPGTLPVLNEYCVEQAVRMGLALGATINHHSEFARKHYFYSDLPHGFQITQLNHPIVSGGSLVVDVPKRNKAGKRLRETFEIEVGIEQIQLEQDSGKNVHDLHPTDTFVDLNRAGVGLMEIVTRPDMRSPDQAASFVKTLQHLLRHIGVSDGNMEAGSLRADVNISIRPEGEAFMGPRVEMKNLNSLRSIMKAIEIESQRQVAICDGDEEGAIESESRLFDVARGETFRMRSKEEALDYRFMPEPDLPPLVLSQEFIERVASTLPELPRVTQVRLEESFGLSKYDASVIVAEVGAPAVFEELVEVSGAPGKVVCNWLVNEVFGHLNARNCSIRECPVPLSHMGSLLRMVNEGTVSGKAGKDILGMLFEGDTRSPSVIAEEEGLTRVNDPALIQGWVDEVVNSNPEAVAKHAGGNPRVLSALVGKAIALSGGRADPALVREQLEETLRTRQ